MSSLVEITAPEDFAAGDGALVVSSWLYASGDRVAAGDPVCEVMVEKASMQIEAPASGVLRILAPVESVVGPGAVIGTVRTLS